MRKLHLKLKIPNEDNGNTVGELFKVFFEEYNENNVFEISEKKLVFEMLFDEKLPTKVIEAISLLHFSGVEELKIEDVEEKESERNADTEQEVMDESSQKVTEVIKLEEVDSKVEDKPENNDLEETSNVEVEQTPKKTKRKKIPDMDEAGQKVFEEVAKNSTSFEDFLESFLAYMGVSKHFWNYFLNMLKKVSTLDETQISDYVSGRIFEEEYNFNKKCGCSNFVKDAFSRVNSKVRFLTFVSEVAKYKNYFPTSGNESADDNEEGAEEKADLVVEEDSEMSENEAKIKELYEGIPEEYSLAQKVEIVLDRTAKKSCVHLEFLEKEDKFVKATVCTLNYYNINRTDYKEAFERCIKSVFKTENLSAKTLFLQVIKDYEVSIGVDTKLWSFFEEYFSLIYKMFM